MANLLIPWQRYLSDVAHKYVGYPDDEEGGEDNMFVVTLTLDEETDDYISDKSSEEIFNAAQNNEFIVAYDNTDETVSKLYICNQVECIDDDTPTYEANFINVVFLYGNGVGFTGVTITGTSCTFSIATYEPSVG